MSTTDRQNEGGTVFAAEAREGLLTQYSVKYIEQVRGLYLREI